MAGLRIAVGGDDAGFAYKEALTKDLKADARVSEVVDVGPNSASDKTAYPHFAIAAAELVAQGKVDRAREEFQVLLPLCSVSGLPVCSFITRSWLTCCFRQC
jgi:hypothetical protein